MAISVPACTGILDYTPGYPVCMSGSWTTFDVSNVAIDWTTFDYALLSESFAAGFLVAAIPLLTVRVCRIVLNVLRGKSP